MLAHRLMRDLSEEAQCAVRVEPGGALDDSTSPLELSPPQVSVPSRLSGASATSNPTSRSTSSWQQQGPAADFEDSIAGQLFPSPRISPVQDREAGLSGRAAGQSVPGLPESRRRRRGLLVAIPCNRRLATVAEAAEELTSFSSTAV
eukprot:s2717_g5.t1